MAGLDRRISPPESGIPRAAATRGNDSPQLRMLTYLGDITLGQSRRFPGGKAVQLSAWCSRRMAQHIRPVRRALPWDGGNRSPRATITPVALGGMRALPCQNFGLG